MADVMPGTTTWNPDPTTSVSPPEPAVLCLLETRRSVKPAGLGAPGPTPEELRRILTVASRVPDHGALVPWRFIVVSGSAREAAGARLAATWAQQNPEADPARRQQMVDNLSRYFTRAPLVVVVVSRADPQARKPEWEQVLTVGAVCMNLITAATAVGYASVWLTGWAAYDEGARAVVGVAPHEKVAGIIHLGTARERPADRPRPILDDLISHWSAK
jgi:nitroreductase